MVGGCLHCQEGKQAAALGWVNGKDAEEGMLQRWGRMADDSILRTVHDGAAVGQLK